MPDSLAHDKCPSEETLEHINLSKHVSRPEYLSGTDLVCCFYVRAMNLRSKNSYQEYPEKIYAVHPVLPRLCLGHIVTDYSMCATGKEVT